MDAQRTAPVPRQPSLWRPSSPPTSAPHPTILSLPRAHPEKEVFVKKKIPANACTLIGLDGGGAIFFSSSFEKWKAGARQSKDMCWPTPGFVRFTQLSTFTSLLRLCKKDQDIGEVNRGLCQSRGHMQQEYPEGKLTARTLPHFIAKILEDFETSPMQNMFKHCRYGEDGFFDPAAGSKINMEAKGCSFGVVLVGSIIDAAKKSAEASFSGSTDLERNKASKMITCGGKEAVSLARRISKTTKNFGGLWLACGVFLVSKRLAENVHRPKTPVELKWRWMIATVLLFQRGNGLVVYCCSRTTTSFTCNSRAKDLSFEKVLMSLSAQEPVLDDSQFCLMPPSKLVLCDGVACNSTRNSSQVSPRWVSCASNNDPLVIIALHEELSGLGGVCARECEPWRLASLRLDAVNTLSLFPRSVQRTLSTWLSTWPCAHAKITDTAAPSIRRSSNSLAVNALPWDIARPDAVKLTDPQALVVATGPAGPTRKRSGQRAFGAALCGGVAVVTPAEVAVTVTRWTWRGSGGEKLLQWYGSSCQH
ncbi:hypothetical protein DFJ73DRAFT_758711 [Zopfochytrium polystomum]|nr:hypothetical protein DFJ73DRAFT_758711 [Zopfochytrium polystomum]